MKRTFFVFGMNSQNSGFARSRTFDSRREKSAAEASKERALVPAPFGNLGDVRLRFILQTTAPQKKKGGRMSVRLA